MKAALYTCLLIIIASLSAKANEPFHYSYQGKDYQVFYGNEQFMSDFNDAYLSLGKNEGCITLPVDHAFTAVSLPFLKSNVDAQAIIGKVSIYFKIEDDLHMEVVDYEELSSTNLCCIPPGSGPEGRNIECFGCDRALYFGILNSPNRNFTINCNGRSYGIELWPEGKNVHMVEKNQKVSALFYLYSNEKCAYNYKITKYTGNTTNVIVEEGDDDTNRDTHCHFYPKDITITEPGVYYVSFRGEYGEGLLGCNGSRIHRNVGGWLCVKYPDITPPTATVAPKVKSIVCNSVRVEALYQMTEGNFEYYFVNYCNKSFYTRASIVGRYVDSYILSGNIRSSGNWSVMAKNICTGEWSGCGPATKITVPSVAAPTLYNDRQSANKYDICEGESVTLFAGTYADKYEWYEVSYDKDGNVVLGKELSSGKQDNGKNYYFTFKSSGLYTARAFKTFTDHNGNPLPCQSYVQSSHVVEIKVHPSAPTAAFSINGTKHYTQVPVTVAFAARWDPRMNYFGDWTFQMDWGDGTIDELSPVRDWAWRLPNATHAYAVPGKYTLRSLIRTPNGCVAEHYQVIDIYRTLCATSVPLLSSTDTRLIQENTINGQFALTNTCVGATTIGCISGVPDAQIPVLAVKASASKLSDYWSFTAAGSGAPANANRFETGARGKWRVQENYVYKAPLLPSEINKESGRFKLVYFDWQTALNGSDGGSWLKTTTIEKYTPNGMPVEEKNALNIKSAAKIGYSNTMPFLVAQNAAYGTVHFESFEKNYSPSTSDLLFEEGFSVPGSQAGLSDVGESHSGQYSLLLKSSTLRLQEIMELRRGERFIVKFWVRNEQSIKGEAISNLTVYLESNSPWNSGYIYPQSERIVAKVGEWQLYEAVIRSSYWGRLQNITPIIRYQGTGNIWIDDVRIQPLEAQLTAYVYDPYTLRLLATFDDQHFGMYHQYDGEGRLVRKLIETERGLKTLQEQHMNAPRVDKETR